MEYYLSTNPAIKIGDGLMKDIRESDQLNVIVATIIMNASQQ